MAGSAALHTDHYELTMLDAAIASGIAGRRSVFEVFARHLPQGRSYGVVGGTGRLLDGLPRFRFDAADLDYLRRRAFLAPATIDWLESFRFAGTMTGYPEGELFFPDSPILTVEASLGEALLLETWVLSVLNFDSAVAAAASRMIQAARGRALIEMGGRRVHEEAAVAAARISCALGFASTSNLEAGRRWGVPTAGTAAHAFTLAYPDERAAFAAQLARQGLETTLLVDTYDVDDGVRTAVAAARAAGGSGPGAVRIDSGDLAETARRVRALLDSLGAQNTKIVASGDLDEFAMERLASAPVEAYGVGTRLVTGSGAPTAELIYKLVAVEDSRGAIVPVAKRSVDKATRGGKKWAWRIAGEEGLAREERILATGDEVPDGGRPLQVPLVKEGEVVHRCSLAEIRSLHEAAVAELGPVGRHLIAPAPALPTTSAGRP